MRLFGWRRREAEARSDRRLLETLLRVEQTRGQNQLALELKQQELQLRLKEIEVENAETLQKVAAKDREDREKLRLARRESVANARARKAANQAARPDPNAPPVCPACQNPTSLDLTPAVVLWHNAGHQPYPAWN